MTTRRNFLKLSALAGGSLGLGLITSSSSAAKKPDKAARHKSGKS